MYKHVLVAVELAAGSDTVVQRSAELVNALNAKMSLMHVIKHSFVNAAYAPKDSIGTGMPAQPSKAEVQKAVDQAKANLEKLAAQAGVGGADVHVWLATSVKAAIRNVALDEQVDLVVIGGYPERGGRQKHLLLGATGYPMLRDAPCDVLVVDLKAKP